MDIEFDKAAQRLAFRQQRDHFVAHLSDGEKKLAFSVAPTPLRSLFAPEKILAGYIAKDSEADPAGLMTAAVAHGCRTALPHVTSRSAPMRFLRWSPGDPLETGPFGLLQPPADSEVCAPDIILVPLIAFDSRLMRLGQGAGHYDRALSLLEDRFAVGLAWSVQHAPAILSDPWDVPMDAILTEKSWITL